MGALGWVRLVFGDSGLLALTAIGGMLPSFFLYLYVSPARRGFTQYFLRARWDPEQLSHLCNTSSDTKVAQGDLFLEPSFPSYDPLLCYSTIAASLSSIPAERSPRSHNKSRACPPVGLATT